VALVAGFGIQVYTPLPPETPVLYGFLMPKVARAGFYYATLDCVREGNSLDGYVWNRRDISTPVNRFELQERIEVTSLGRARRLVHGAPKWRNADPLCMQADGFISRKQSLISSFFN
jgi:hypothetical protein